MIVESEQINKTKGYRRLEMIPGILMIATYVVLFALSFWQPLWVITFIMIYALLWFVRVAYFVTYLFIAWKKYKVEIETDWMTKVRAISGWDKKYHVVFYPHWSEPFEVIDYTLESLKATNYPNDKIIVVFGGEDRAGEGWKEREKKLHAKYKDTFFKFMTTTHEDADNEVVGKSANANYMARQFHKVLDEELHIPYEDLIVSNFDSDTTTHPEYFARLAYAYLTHPNPTRASYQPLALFDNNVWESQWFARVVATSTSFWLLTELARPEQFMTFSSHSMSWKALVDVGYWQKDIVTEDSRIFLQCYLRYDGDYELVPMYVPVNMDTVSIDSLKGTIINQYKQIRRWAWSAEHQAYLIKFFSQNKIIPFWKKIRYIFKLVEGQLSWATAPILLLVFTRLPLHIASLQGNTSVLVQNAPIIIERFLQFSMIGMLFSAYFSIKLLPGKPQKKVLQRYGGIILQWLLLPFTMIIFGSIPAIEAQWRLMIGKHLAFWNTQKARIKKD